MVPWDSSNFQYPTKAFVRGGASALAQKLMKPIHAMNSIVTVTPDLVAWNVMPIWVKFLLVDVIKRVWRDVIPWRL